MYWLNILKSLLVVLRVSLFPWMGLDLSLEEGAVIRLVFEKYLVYLQDSTLKTDHFMALEAIDTILSGCRLRNASLYRELVHRIGTGTATRETDDLLRYIIRQYE